MNSIPKPKFINIVRHKYLIPLIATLYLNSQANAFVDNSTPVRNSLVNLAPVFNSSVYSFNISEEAALGTSAGTVSATDGDGDQLSYSIKSGNTNATLSINPSTGSITIAKRLNHNTQDSFILIVKVTDPGGLTGQAKAIISVKGALTQPAINNITWGTAASQQYTVNESQGEVVEGRLYTFGGFDSQKPSFTPTSRAYVFDPVLNKWTGIAPMPPMNGTNYGGVTHAGFTTDGTDIYFAGGYTSNSTGTGQKFGTKEVWKYIVAGNRYVRLPDLPIAIAAGQLEYLAGKLHHISGTNAARTLDLGDHYVLNLDSLSAGWKKSAPLPNPRQHAGSVVYNNKIYFIGGQHGQDDKLVAQKEVHSYDPHTNVWTKLADLTVPAGATGRGHISSASIVMGDYIVVIAGETVHNSGRTNMVSAYLPQTNTWSNLTPLPQTRYSGVAANLGGLMYYTGGSKTSITYKGVNPSSIQSIQNFLLINAQTDQPIKALTTGDTLDLNTLPGTQLNILAVTDPVKVGSVQFTLTGPQNNNVIESTAPYALFGDNGSGDFYPWTPTVGNYTLKATPYSSSGGKGIAGTPKTVTFTVINNAQQDIALSPIADAFVRNGSFATSNYGDTTVIIVKSSPSSGFTRHSYFKFSLNSVSSINSATLRVYGFNTSNNSGVLLAAYGVNNDSWTEGGINFNNAPASLTSPLSSASVTNVAKYYDFDVTAFIKAQFTGDKTATLVIKDPERFDKNLVFNSKENAQNRPQLLIQSGIQSKGQVNNVTASLTR